MTSAHPNPHQNPRRPQRSPQESLRCHYATSQAEQLLLRQPEFRLELINGKFVVGGTLDGSYWLLREAMQGWGLEAAIAFAPLDLWWSALRTAYEVPCQTPDDWLAWAESLPLGHRCHNLPPLGSRYVREHLDVRDRLHRALANAVTQGSIGQCFGPHYGLWMGDDVLTPDIQMLEDLHLIENPCFDRYLQGPASLVVEVMWPEWAHVDTKMRQQRYEKQGITHYWTINPLTQHVQFWQWSDQGYEVRSPDADGCYRGLSGLNFTPELLWECLKGERLRGENPSGESRKDDSTLPIVTSQRNRRPWQLTPQDNDEGIPWDGLPFAPKVGLEPVAMTPEQFLAWCPDSKLDRGPLIGGSQWGTRNAIAMLMMTLGLVETVRLMPGYEWVRVLRRLEREQAKDAEKRAHWLSEAKAIAQSLREEYAIGGIGLIGDLLNEQPLNHWSEVHLMLWDIPKGFSKWQVQHLTEVPIRMTEVAWASPADWQAMQQNMTVLVGKWKEQEAPRSRQRLLFQWDDSA